MDRDALRLAASDGGRVERPTGESALSVRGLTVAYGAVPAVFSVDATLPLGTLTAILGPNGAGKSTFLKALLGIVTPLAGQVEVFGAPLRAARRRLAYVPQRASVDWDFPVTVAEVVAMGLHGQLGLFGRLGETGRVRVAEALDEVGMAGFADRQIGQLSGGQQQRVFLARALAQGADLYLLDEPFAGVDAATEAAIVAVLQRLRDGGKTLAVVHHDLATVEAYFDRILLLNRVKIAEGAVSEAFTEETLAAAYRGLARGPSSLRGPSLAAG